MYTLAVCLDFGYTWLNKNLSTFQPSCTLVNFEERRPLCWLFTYRWVKKASPVREWRLKYAYTVLTNEFYARMSTLHQHVVHLDGTL